MSMTDISSNHLHHHQQDQANTTAMGMQMPQPTTAAAAAPWPAAAATVDERDAYIAWLRSEFAAANAVIDSMCHHLRTIGGPGEYETVFTSLQKRRHAWAPSLYMQQFFSVAEIVNSLQQVAWKKHQAQRAAAMSAAKSPPKDVSAPPYPPSVQVDETAMAKVAKAVAATRPVQVDATTAATMTADVEVDVELDLPEAQVYQGSVQSNHSEMSKKCDANHSKIADQNAINSHHVDDDMHPAPSSNGALAAESKNKTLLASSSTEEFSPDCNAAPSTESECNNSIADPSDLGINIPDKHVENVVPTDQSQNTKDDPALTSSKGPKTQDLLNKELSIASNEENERVSGIKRSTQFHCCEREDGQIINNGETVELCENVFSAAETMKLIEIISQLQGAGSQGELGGSFSRCKDSKHVPDTMQFGPKVRNGPETNNILPIPKFLQPVIKWLTQCSILSANRRPDSCVISIFDQGDFEPPNTDQCFWEKPLCIISLTGDSTMVFGHSISADQDGNCKGPFEVVLPAGSVLLLQESFAGILQKAVTASPSKRITIALGKSLSANTGTKTRNKPWAAGAHHQNGSHVQKQGYNTGMPHPLPAHPFPPIMSHPFFPSPMSPYMVAQGWSAVPRFPRLHNTGTGVFFPSSDPHGGASLIVVSSFPSKTGSLLSPASSLEVRRSRKGEKHNQFSANQAKVKGSLVSLDIVTPKKKSAKHIHVGNPCQGIEGTPTAETVAAK